MYHHLRMHGGDEKVVLILGTHLSLVSYSEQVQLVVGGSDDCHGLRHRR